MPGLVTGEGSLCSARNLNRCHLAGSEMALQFLAIAQAACPSIQCASQIPCIPTALPFVILHTLLASLFKTSFKYYVKMVQIILWHWVLQAGDSLQLCHGALPAPAPDGHIQLVTKTALSHPLWLLDISLLLKSQEGNPKFTAAKSFLMFITWNILRSAGNLCVSRHVLKNVGVNDILSLKVFTAMWMGL